MAEFRVGGLLFTSKFDSGNLARVEKVSKDEDEEGTFANIPRILFMFCDNVYFGFNTACNCMITFPCTLSMVPVVSLTDKG